MSTIGLPYIRKGQFLNLFLFASPITFHHVPLSPDYMTNSTFLLKFVCFGLYYFMLIMKEMMTLV